MRDYYSTNHINSNNNYVRVHAGGRTCNCHQPLSHNFPTLNVPKWKQMLHSKNDMKFI